MSDRILYVFTLTPRRRSRPNPRYEGVLRTHRFYAEYYYLLADQDPVKVVNGGRPVIAFPARHDSTLVEFAKELGGEVAYERRVPLPSANQSYVRRIIGFRSEVDYRRHMFFSLVASTMVKPNRLASAMWLARVLNPIFVNTMTNIAVDRYEELAGVSARPYYVLRVGMAIKVLYMLDR